MLLDFPRAFHSQESKAYGLYILHDEGNCNKNMRGVKSSCFSCLDFVVDLNLSGASGLVKLLSQSNTEPEEFWLPSPSFRVCCGMVEFLSHLGVLPTLF